MTAVLGAVTLGATLACPGHMLWRMRRRCDRGSLLWPQRTYQLADRQATPGPRRGPPREAPRLALTQAPDTRAVFSRRVRGHRSSAWCSSSTRPPSGVLCEREISESNRRRTQRFESRAVRTLPRALGVKAGRKLTPWRRLKIDPLGGSRRALRRRARRASRSGARRARVIRGGVGGSGEVAVFEAVAVAFEREDLGVVDEPVDHRGGDDVVAEDLAPGREGLVAGDDQRGAFVAAARRA